MKTKVTKTDKGYSFETENLDGKESIVESIAEIQMKIWEQEGVSVKDGLEAMQKQLELKRKLKFNKVLEFQFRLKDLKKDDLIKLYFDEGLSNYETIKLFRFTAISNNKKLSKFTISHITNDLLSAFNSFELYEGHTREVLSHIEDYFLTLK